MSATVAILGGGIAGLTAAHELAGRGLKVTVYELRGGGVRGLGGKARSQYFRVNGVEVPGEHGFRFMPAFYTCLPETMRRIPVGASARAAAFREPVRDSVADGLVGLEHMAVARDNFPLLTIHRNAPRPWELTGLALTLAKAFHSISGADLRHIGLKFLHYFTRGPIERRHVHEHTSFFDYMEAGRLQPIARRLLECMPQSLVAMKASEGSARTLLDVLQLMMLDFGRPGASEWVLPGPTTDTWLAPWARWLQRLGVRFEQGPAHRITRIETRGDGLAGTYAIRVGRRRFVALPGPPTDEVLSFAVEDDMVHALHEGFVGRRRAFSLAYRIEVAPPCAQGAVNRRVSDAATRCPSADTAISSAK